MNHPMTHLPTVKFDELGLNTDLFKKFKNNNVLLRDTLADYFYTTDKSKLDAAVTTAQSAAFAKALNKAKWRSRLTSLGAGAGSALGGLGGYGIGTGLSRLFLGDRDTVNKDKSKLAISRWLRFGGGALGALAGGISGHMLLNSKFGVPSIERSLNEDLTNIRGEATTVDNLDLKPVLAANMSFNKFK